MPKNKGMFKKKTTDSMQHPELIGPRWSSNPWAGGQFINISRCTSMVKRAARSANGTPASRNRTKLSNAMVLGCFIKITFSNDKYTNKSVTFNSAGRVGDWSPDDRTELGLESISEAIRQHGDLAKNAGQPPPVNSTFDGSLPTVAAAPGSYASMFPPAWSVYPTAAWPEFRLDALGVDADASHSDSDSDSDAGAPVPLPPQCAALSPACLYRCLFRSLRLPPFSIHPFRDVHANDDLPPLCRTEYAGARRCNCVLPTGAAVHVQCTA